MSQDICQVHSQEVILKKCYLQAQKVSRQRGQTIYELSWITSYFENCLDRILM